MTPLIRSLLLPWGAAAIRDPTISFTFGMITREIDMFEDYELSVIGVKVMDLESGNLQLKGESSWDYSKVGNSS